MVVAPRAGAWIETKICRKLNTPLPRLLPRDAWIETLPARDQSRVCMTEADSIFDLLDSQLRFSRYIHAA
jgi:hypothetical protein